MTVLLAIALLAISGCSAAAWLTAPSAELLVATTTSGPVRLDLALDGPPRNDRPSWATARVENVAAVPVLWSGGGCGDPVSISVDLGPALEGGRDWPGLLGRFKSLALGEPGGPIGSPTTVGFVEASRFGRQIACTSDLRIETLAAGAVLQMRAAWDGNLNGSPASTGAATVQAVFPLIAGQANLQTMDFKTIPVSITIDTTVAGSEAVGGPVALSPALAIDAALADPEFAAWVMASPEGTWINPDLVPNGENWSIGLFRTRPAGQGEMFGEVTVDASGAVVARRFEP